MKSVLLDFTKFIEVSGVNDNDWISTVLSSPFMKIMADSLNRSSNEMDPRATPLYKAVIGHVGPERTVIDIGAGVGRFAIPLAQDGIKVTAVEPSDEMRRHLKEAIASSGLSSGINVVPSSWPVDKALTAEVVFASFVIQFSKNPMEFIHAMERSARNQCILSVHVDQPLEFLRNIWQVFRPTEPVPVMLTFSDLYPMLLNMGIIANVAIIEEKRMSRPVMEPAKIITLLSDLLSIRDKPADMQRLKEILEGMRSRIQEPPSMRTAIVSWQPRR